MTSSRAPTAPAAAQRAVRCPWATGSNESSEDAWDPPRRATEPLFAFAFARDFPLVLGLALALAFAGRLASFEEPYDAAAGRAFLAMAALSGGGLVLAIVLRGRRRRAA